MIASLEAQQQQARIFDLPAANPAAVSELLDRLEAAENLLAGVCEQYEEEKTKARAFEQELDALKKQKPVAVVVSADEYGPCLEWGKHWLNFIGATLYASSGAQGEEK